MKRNNLTTSFVVAMASVAGVINPPSGCDIGPRDAWGAPSFPTRGKSRNKPDKRKQRGRK